MTKQELGEAIEKLENLIPLNQEAPLRLVYEAAKLYQQGNEALAARVEGLKFKEPDKDDDRAHYWNQAINTVLEEIRRMG